MNENMFSDSIPAESISNLLAVIGKPARVQILMVIGDEEACVCHIKAVLGLRQASISQHLMVLRKAGLVTTNRDGRNIFYKLNRPELIDLLDRAAAISSSESMVLRALSRRPIQGCSCPQCNPGMDTKLTCRPKKTE